MVGGGLGWSILILTLIPNIVVYRGINIILLVKEVVVVVVHFLPEISAQPSTVAIPNDTISSIIGSGKGVPYRAMWLVSETLFW